MHVFLHEYVCVCVCSMFVYYVCVGKCTDVCICVWMQLACVYKRVHIWKTKGSHIPSK